MAKVLVIHAVFDPEVRVWFTESSDIHGLRIEAPTFDALVERLPGVIEDLLSDGDTGMVDAVVEVIAHASAHVRVPEAA